MKQRALPFFHGTKTYFSQLLRNGAAWVVCLFLGADQFASGNQSMMLKNMVFSGNGIVITYSEM